MNHPTSGVHLHQGAAAQLHQNISGEHLHQTCRTIPGVAESQIHADSGLVSALDREVHLHLMDVEIGEPNHTDLNFFLPRDVPSSAHLSLQGRDRWIVVIVIHNVHNAPARNRALYVPVCNSDTQNANTINKGAVSVSR